MRPFLDEDFLLDTQTARALYHGVAEGMPILDYHCHVSPREIAEDRVFRNLPQLWLEGDHYKWRLMRANGVSERLITGSAPDEEKFQAWAATLERSAGNPLYHWSHLELKRYFGYDGHLTGANAKEVWDHCQAVIGEGMHVRDILKKSNVTLICTTDDPADTLEWHERLSDDPTLETKVLPAFRPDRAVNLEKEDFPEYIKRLSASAGMEIGGWQSLLDALEQRLNFFDAHGCALADHGLDNICFRPAGEAELDGILKKRLAGEGVTEEELWQYKTALLLFFGRGYAKRGWAMQMHFAAQRNNNSRMYRLLGPDTGYDSIGPAVHLPDLAAFLNALDENGELPRTILYSLEPGDNAGLVTLMGCYQGEGVRGKLQHGSAWWFNDCKEGMEAQLKNLAAGGVLGKVIAATDMVNFIKEQAGTLEALGIFFPFLLAAILKTAQGSSTVAITTTAGILAPVMATLGLDTPVAAALAVMAIGAGAMTVSHANDSYFWVVTNFGAMQPDQGYKTQTVATGILGIAGVLNVWIVYMICTAMGLA